MKLLYLYKESRCDRRGLDHTGRVTKDQGRQPQFVDSVGLGVATTDPSLTQNLSQNFKKSNADQAS